MDKLFLPVESLTGDDDARRVDIEDVMGDATEAEDTTSDVVGKGIEEMLDDTIDNCELV